MAAQNGHTEALRVLIGAGGDPNKAQEVSAPRVRERERDRLPFLSTSLSISSISPSFFLLSGWSNTCLHSCSKWPHRSAACVDRRGRRPQQGPRGERASSEREREGPPSLPFYFFEHIINFALFLSSLRMVEHLSTQLLKMATPKRCVC